MGHGISKKQIANCFIYYGLLIDFVRFWCEDIGLVLSLRVNGPRCRWLILPFAVANHRPLFGPSGPLGEQAMPWQKLTLVLLNLSALPPATLQYTSCGFCCFCWWCYCCCCCCCCWSLTVSQPACHASGFAYVDNLKLDADMIRVLKPDPITFGAYWDNILHLTV